MTNFLSYIKEYDSMTSIIIIIFGWVIVHYLSKRRDIQNFNRKNLETIYDLLHSLEEEAIQFHTSSSYNKEKSSHIYSQISHLERKINRLGFIKNEDFSSEIKCIRQSVTLANFDCSNFKQQKFENSKILNEITNCISDLEQKLYNKTKTFF